MPADIDKSADATGGVAYGQQGQAKPVVDQAVARCRYLGFVADDERAAQEQALPLQLKPLLAGVMHYRDLQLAGGLTRRLAGETGRQCLDQRDGRWVSLCGQIRMPPFRALPARLETQHSSAWMGGEYLKELNTYCMFKPLF